MQISTGQGEERCYCSIDNDYEPQSLMPLPGWNQGIAGGYAGTYLRVPVLTAHEITAGVCSLLICAAQGNQLDLLTAKLDLELIAGQ
jgi:hypothetical protein